MDQAAATPRCARRIREPCPPAPRHPGTSSWLVGADGRIEAHGRIFAHHSRSAGEALMSYSTKTTTAYRVLVVDDEPHLVRAVRMYLELQGYTVFGAHSGEEAIEGVREKLPDLVILDVMMPGLDGFETLDEVRRFSQVPVIMLTARGEEDQKVQALKLGADDYVTKPFSQRELLARVQAVLRRAEQPAILPKTRIDVDQDLSIDFDRGEVYVRGKPVRLTATEYRLLYHLAGNPGRLMPSETLLAKV
jgi:DNA-binding response OmpR family regulator